MNERIQQLARQLGPVGTIGNWGRVNWADEVYPQHGDKLYAAIDLEKFAELIVRECATIINDIPSSPQGSWSDGYYEGCRDSAKQIQQHFGVEL